MTKEPGTTIMEKAEEIFEMSRKLQEKMDIPYSHWGQHFEEEDEKQEEREYDDLIHPDSV